MFLTRRRDIEFMIVWLEHAIQKAKVSAFSLMTTVVERAFTSTVKGTPITLRVYSSQSSLLIISVTLAFVFGCDWGQMVAKPVVSQTTNPVTPSEVPDSVFGDVPLPSSATKVYYALSGVGLGGRFKAFRLNGTVEDLQLLIAAYLETQNANARIHRQDGISFDEYVPNSEFVSENYGVEIGWLEPFRGVRGSVFCDDDGGPVFLLDTEGKRLAMIWMD